MWQQKTVFVPSFLTFSCRLLALKDWYRISSFAEFGITHLSFCSLSSVRHSYCIVSSFLQLHIKYFFLIYKAIKVTVCFCGNLCGKEGVG